MANDGTRLETEFAKFMSASLGYRRTNLRSHVKGRVANRGYEVDIHGVRYPFVWDAFRFLGLYGLFLGFVGLIFPQDFEPMFSSLASVVAVIDPSLAPYTILIFMGLAFAIGLIGKRRSTVNAWVECKDRKTRVKRADVQKLVMSVKDVRDLKQSDWFPDRIVMVSTAGFDVDALSVARDHGVVCYAPSSDGYAEV